MAMMSVLIFLLLASAESLLLCLQAEDYAAAWDCICVNRMDMALIASHAWPRFLERAGAFVHAVPRDQDLCDFLAALRPHGPGGLAAQLQAAGQVPADALTAR